MAMASGALALPSFLASKDVITVAKVSSLPLLRPSCSLELRHGSRKDMSRSSILRTLRSGNSGVAKLATSSEYQPIDF